ncbi:MAG: V-type ATP synthase subunit F [Deltaproteobacteria bacterium]|nr:V-type ATP synthase subunit F [Deltaproteobacteria bacterium]MBW2121798.1 V-type ATP synthase subunit F [Deltaproteobacteria bacterium]
MSNVAVIGDRDSILCFRAIGVLTFPVAEPREARAVVRRLLKEKVSVIFITEAIAQSMMDLIDEVSRASLPSIVLIPNSQGSLGLGMERIRQTVTRAVGADIFGKGEET